MEQHFDRMILVPFYKLSLNFAQTAVKKLLFGGYGHDVTLRLNVKNLVITHSMYSILKLNLEKNNNYCKFFIHV